MQSRHHHYFTMLFRVVNTLVLTSLFIISSAWAGNNAPIGPVMVNMAPVTHEELERALKERDIADLAANTFNSFQQSRVVRVSPRMIALKSVSTEISELARALKHDPDLIYEFVKSQIEYEPLFGVMKGAVGALIDKRGNAFDQSALMVDLLRASGYTANYVYGKIRLNPEQTMAWVGASDYSAAFNVIGNGAIPIENVYQDSIDITHTWVEVSIDGVKYAFDPSFKQYQTQVGIDIAQVTGYDTNNFISKALSGATVTADYAQNINQSNVREALTEYATHLVTELKSNHSEANLSEIIGAKVTQPEVAHVRQTALAYQQAIIEKWPAEIPVRYQTRLRIKHLGIDVTYSSADIYGKRLTLRYTASNKPELRLNGQLVGSGNVVSVGSSQKVNLSISHPYAFSGANQSGDQSIEARPGYTYLITNGWGSMGKGMLDRHQKILADLQQSGQEASSEAVLGENLMLIASHWIIQGSLSGKLSGALSKSVVLRHHWVGIAGHKTGPYVDLPFNVSAPQKLDRAERNTALFFSIAGAGSALEHGVIEQTQAVGAVSTVQLLDFANSQSNRIFDVTQANFAAVKPLLVGYSEAQLRQFKGAYLDKGFRILLPENGLLDQEEGDSWQGYGALLVSQNEDRIMHLIGGGLKGGFARKPVPPRRYLPPISIPKITNAKSTATGQTSYDPIDLVSGDFLYDNTDISIGSTPFPVGLGFERHYSSAGRRGENGMGYGWTHNYNITVKEESNAYQALGQDSPVDASAAIVASYIALDILKGEKTNEKLIILAIIEKWMMDQLTDNAININSPGDTQQFIKLPDGSYNPGPGSLSKLSKKADGSYQLRNKTGVIMDFDNEGKLKTRQDTNGNTLTLTYNSDGQVSRVENNFSQALTIQYQNKKVSEVLDGNGRKTQYQYDANNNLIRFTNANNETTRYVYDLEGRMTQVFTPAHPETAMVTNIYDTRDKVTEQTNGDGYTYNYYFAGYRSEEVDPDGQRKVWYYTHYGKPLRVIDGLNREIISEYNGQQQIKRQILPEGNAIEYDYDPYHRVTKITTLPKPGASELTLTQSYQYENQYHKLTQNTDTLGRITTLSYDTKGNLIEVQYPTIEGVIPTIKYSYNVNGLRQSERDAEGRLTQFYYDSTGNLTRSTLDPDNLNLVTNQSYDSVGNIISQTDPKNNTTQLVYDAERRLIKTIAPAPFNTITEYTYDKEGQLLSQRNQADGTQQPWQQTSYTYNRNGKVLQVTDPQGHLTDYIYDGNNRLITRTDAENRLTDTLYDAVGQVIKVSQLLNEIPVTLAEYKYTENGKQKSVTDGNGNTTNYQYDGHDRLISTSYPNNTQELLRYDPASNIVKQRTRAGQWFTYRYDALNRQVSKTRPDGSQVISKYDLSGITTKVTENNKNWLYENDSLGRRVKTTNPAGKIVQYAYDQNSNRTQLTYPDGFIVDYSYDSLDRLESIKQDGKTLAAYRYDALSRRKTLDYGDGSKTHYEYEIDNDLATITVESALTPVSYDYQYNAVGQITNKQSNFGRYNRYYANNYRIRYHLRWGSFYSNTNGYQANRLNQYQEIQTTYNLVRRSGWANRDYGYSTQNQYDQNGNLTQVNQNGRVQKEYNYDAENKLIEINQRGQQYYYSYDPFGRRIKTQTPGQDHYTVKKGADGKWVWTRIKAADQFVNYIYAADQVLMEEDDQGHLLKRYIYGDGVDELLLLYSWTNYRNEYTERNEPIIGYYHLDGTGSVGFLTRGNEVRKGGILGLYKYAVYGGSELSFDNIANPYKFAGRRFDKKTGLYYNRARYYDPEIGRFLQADPIGYSDGLNMYAYVSNDPLNFVDPSGLLGKRISNAFSINKAAVDFTLGLSPIGGLGEAYYAAQAGDYTAAAIAAAQEIPVVKVFRVGHNVFKATKSAGKAPDFIVSKGGTAFPVPKGATGPSPVVNPGGKKTGSAFTGGKGGANGQVDTMRIMNPTQARGKSPGYPNGYIKYENRAGQGVNPNTGRTISNKDSHFPIN